MRIGVLTGGGDSPGEGAFIDALCRAAWETGGDKVITLVHGWAGLLNEPEKIVSRIPELRALNGQPLTPELIQGWWQQAGSPIGSERVNPFEAKTKDPVEAKKIVATNLDRIKNRVTRLLDALVTVGGDDTNGAGLKLYQQIGLPVVGVPQTMDLNIGLTEKTIGFETACEMGAECARSQAAGMRSFARCGVLEVYGRDEGHVALRVALASRASGVLIPEACNSPGDLARELDFVCRRIQRDGWGEVIVAEGVKIPKEPGAIISLKDLDQFGHERLAAQGIGKWVAGVIENRCGLRADAVQLLHVIRGKPPLASDVELATVFGLKAVELVRQQKFGRMVAWQNGRVTDVDLAEALAVEHKVDLDYLESLRSIFA